MEHPEDHVPHSELEHFEELARELHDGVGQLLTAARLMAEGTPDCPPVISSLLTEAILELHRICSSLVEIEDVDGDLVAGLATLAERTSMLPGITCKVTVETAEVLLTAHQAKELYRIAQEAVTNAASHAGAQQISITLRSNDMGTLLEVADDGAWKATEVGRMHLGLRNMKSRAANLGGTLEIQKGDERTGSFVRCWIPRALPII